MQPILVVLVFGNLLPRLGLVAGNFGTVLMPGLMAITMLMTGVQGILMPLSGDLPARGRSTSGCSLPSTPSASPSSKILSGGPPRRSRGSSPCP